MRTEPVRNADSQKAQISFTENLLNVVQSGNWEQLGDFLGDRGENLAGYEFNGKETLDLLKTLQSSEYPRIKEYFIILIKNDLNLTNLSEEQMDELSSLDPYTVLHSIDLTRLSLKRLNNLKPECEVYGLHEKIQQAITDKEQAKKAHLWWCIAL